MITRKDRQFLRQCIANAVIFSTCIRRQYFAIVVDKYEHIIGTGYNGVPKGMTHCDKGGCPRAALDVAPRSPYTNCLAIHAEANALLHSDYTSRRDGCTLYVNGTPCWDCAKLIANSGVARLMYLCDVPCEKNVEDILLMSGVETIPFSMEALDFLGVY